MEVKGSRDPMTDMEASHLGKRDRESGSGMHRGVGGGLRWHKQLCVVIQNVIAIYPDLYFIDSNMYLFTCYHL